MQVRKNAEVLCAVLQSQELEKRVDLHAEGEDENSLRLSDARASQRDESRP